MKKIYILATLITVAAINSSFAKALRNNKEPLSVIADKNLSSVLAVDFSANDTLTCTGTIKFTDLSANGASAWIWYFGDGGASTVQNPSHTYTSAGYFTVTLITVGIAGIDSTTKTDYIHVDFLPAPTVSPDTTICKYNPATLYASGTGTIAWFDSLTGGSLLDTGNVFTSLPLTAATTFYAENEQTQVAYHGGAPDTTIGTGNIYTANQNRYMTFDVNVACRLVSFLVYAQGAADRTIYIADNNGNQLQSKIVNIPDGASRVYVNFDLPVGTGYRIGIAVQGGPGGNAANLYRNNAGAVYPYDINGLVSITGNNGAPTYYYFFYDWEVSFPPCVSPRVPVTVNVTPGPQASFLANQNLNIVTCSDLSLGATTWTWDFGDGSGISNLQNPVHTYTAAGTYTITLTASNGTCSSSQVTTIVVTTAAGINEHNSLQVNLQPNPVKDLLTINLPKNANKVSIEVVNNLGQTVYTNASAETSNSKYTVNFASFIPGVYTLKIEANDQVTFKKIIKE